MEMKNADTGNEESLVILSHTIQFTELTYSILQYSVDCYGQGNPPIFPTEEFRLVCNTLPMAFRLGT